MINEKRLNILSKIEEVVAKLHHGDLLLIYYSGHGETLADKKLYLAASNTIKSLLASTALSYDDILTVLEHFYQGTTMIILDCCHSGMAGVNARGETKAPALGYGVELASGMCLITASSAHEVAKEQECYHGGIFTHYLVEGLKSGANSLDQDGIIRPHELYEYVFEKVKAAGHEQTPLIKSNIQGVLPFFTRKIISSDPLDEIKNRLVYAHETEELRHILNELIAFLKQNPTSYEGIKLKKHVVKRVLDQEFLIPVGNFPHQVKPKNDKSETVSLRPSPQASTDIFKPARRESKIIGFTEYVGEIPITKMIHINGGRFEMGAQSDDGEAYGDEIPLHLVQVKSFLLGATPVTFEQYDFYSQATKKPFPKDEGWGRKDRPVINVSWEDAQGYIQWLNQETGRHYRLPTEAEWEYACRAGTTTKYSWGDEFYYSRYANNNHKHTTPVGSFLANPWGLFDLHGNVQQWCEDRWHFNYEGAPNDGSAWLAGDADARVLRGGSWDSFARYLRSSYRTDCRPSVRDSSVGFRIAQIL